MLKTMRERCQELLPVIQGGAEGKVIQRNYPGDSWWADCGPNAPLFDQESTYRIKPEPQYRPFTHQELAGHIGNKVRQKGPRPASSPHYTVWGLTGNERVLFHEAFIEVHGFQHLLDWWEFTDGSPCGVLIP